ncbi:hypothetical protein R5R35_002709 [Gryllus longicercus]|uniref:Transmembrane protein 209 n=1 Tax=Gryllus longicercus TaxID=2509291 RepID=A0AAN9WK82_9ORTH
MDKILRSSSPYVNTAVMDEFLNVTEKSAKARKIFWYLLGNSVVSCILLYDTLQVCPDYSFWVRVLGCNTYCWICLNTLFHVYLYYQATASLNPVAITPSEKSLLGVSDADTHFKISTPLRSSSPVSSTSGSATPINLSAVSWLSTGSGSSPGFNSNMTMSAASWEYLPNISRCASFSKGSQDNSQLAPKLFDLNNFSNSSIGLIDNEDSLSRYLSEFEEYEKSFEQSTNALWKNSSGRFKVESPILKSCNYLYSTPSPVQKTGSSGDTPDELVNSSALKNPLDVWGRFGVDRTLLTQWNSNLRRWISETVLERIVREIDALDQTFQRSGLADIKMGGVGLERLKKTVQMAQVSQNMPTFPLLVRFLELSSNQEYLVTRIRELAKGGCMSEFRWNGGGKLHGKDWDEHLPTDAALVMYLLATYLDTQLPPLPHNPEGQPFTSEYLIKAPNKVPPGKNSPIIQEVQVNPPHFVIFVSGKKKDIGKGRNNFFHTLLLFLYEMNEREHGMLGRVNMGPSGINILWVIDR